MNNLKDSILQVLNLIEDTSMHFYQQKVIDGYHFLDKTIDKIMETLNIILPYSSENYLDLISEQELQLKLGKAMDAIERKNPILIADILTYELKNVFVDILTQLD